LNGAKFIQVWWAKVPDFADESGFGCGDRSACVGLAGATIKTGLY
jgi:hypothetical protein